MNGQQNIVSNVIPKQRKHVTEIVGPNVCPNMPQYMYDNVCCNVGLYI